MESASESHMSSGMATPVTESEWVDVETSGRLGEDSQRKAVADEIVAKALLHEWVTAREEENLVIPGPPPGCEDIDRIVTSLNVPEAMTSRLWLADTALTCPFGQMHAQGYQHQDDSGSDGVAQVPLEERPTMLSLVRIMAEQLAAQALSIEQLRAKDAPNEDHAIPDLSKTVQDLNTSIKRMNDQIASQAEIIKHLKASQTSQSHTVEELKSGNEQLRTENAALQSTNASLENKIETLSEMQKLSHTTLSSQQGHIESLHDVVRTKLGNNDSKMSILTARMTAAESGISAQKTSMDDQLKSQDVNIRNTINSWQSDLKMDMDDLENRAMTRLANLDDKLNADMNSTMSRLADADGKLYADMNEIHNLQETIKAQGTSIAGLTTSGDRLQEEIHVLAQDIEGFPEQFAPRSMTEEVNMMHQQILNADQSMRDVHGELKTVKAEVLEKIEKDKAELTNLANSMDATAEIEALKEETDKIKSEMERIDTLEENLETAQDDLMAAQDSIEEMKDAQSKTETEVTELGTKFARTGLEIRTANNKFTSATDDITKLKQEIMTTRDEDIAKVKQDICKLNIAAEVASFRIKRTSISIEEIKELQSKKHQEMGKAIEDIEPVISPIQFGLRGEQPRKATPSPTFNFGDDATTDPNGDDFGGLGRNGDDEYYDSFELGDRRCGVSGVDMLHIL